MEASGIHLTELVFLFLLAFVILFAVLAKKLETPYPIILVIAGLCLSFIPAVPKISINPEVIFLVVLPPLLYQAAWLTSWRDFRFNIVSISMLAIGLVAFTAIGVAETAPFFFNGFDWRLGFVLGAVVATTDAIAATSIAQRVGLPKRIMDILEGESLVNDATGLVALEFAVAMVVRGQRPTLGAGFSRLTLLIVGGIAVGLLIGLLVEWFERRVEDAAIEITLSIMVPYAVYLAAERVHTSGVLAVVACGLYLSRKSSEFFSSGVRMRALAVWEALGFVLNGLVFVAIGLQLPHILSEMTEYRLRDLILYGLAFSALMIVIRLVWLYPAAAIAYFVRNKILHQHVQKPGPKQIFVVGWAGMRGVVALAAALSIPETLADGSPFPQRNLIIFLTFSVIIVTLVGQGLSLPWLIRVLGLGGAVDDHHEEKEARRKMTEIALQYLEASREKDGEEMRVIHEELERLYRARLAKLDRIAEDKTEEELRPHYRKLEIMAELNRLERRAAVHMRNEGLISDEVLRELEHELDLGETKLSLSRKHVGHS